MKQATEARIASPGRGEFRSVEENRVSLGNQRDTGTRLEVIRGEGSGLEAGGI